MMKQDEDFQFTCPKLQKLKIEKKKRLSKSRKLGWSVNNFARV